MNKNVEQALTLSPFAKLTKGIQNLGASLGPKNQAGAPADSQYQEHEQQLPQEQGAEEQEEPAPELDEYKARIASSQSRTKFVLLWKKNNNNQKERKLHSKVEVIITGHYLFGGQSSSLLFPQIIQSIFFNF